MNESSLTTLQKFTVWAHQELNPANVEYTSVSDDLTDFMVAEGAWAGVEAKTPENTLSNTHTTGKELFEGARGHYRLTQVASNLTIDIDAVKVLRANAVRVLRSKDLTDNVKLVFKEGHRKTVTGEVLVRNGGVRKASLNYHGRICMCCDRTPQELGFEDSFLDTHHLNELKTYEENGIEETDITSQIIVVCVGCHKAHIHKRGHKNPLNLKDARASYQAAILSNILIPA